MAGVIARLEAEIAGLDQAIVHVIGRDEDLRARHDLLISVPGIATHTAAVILSELPGCCARRGRRRPMPVSIPAIGILARRAVPDLPDRQRHFAGGTLSSRPRRAPLEPAGPAPAFEGPEPAQAQADRRSRDAQTAAPVLWRAQDRQTIRSQPRHLDRGNGRDDLNDRRLRKTDIIPLFDCQPIIPSSRSARRHARRAGQGGPARRRRAVSLTGLSTVAPFLRSRRRKRLDAEHGISPGFQQCVPHCLGPAAVLPDWTSVQRSARSARIAQAPAGQPRTHRAT